MTAAFGSEAPPKPRPLLMLSIFADLVEVDSEVDWGTGVDVGLCFGVESADRVRSCISDRAAKTF